MFILLVISNEVEFSGGGGGHGIWVDAALDMVI